jgi:hypothetical protein
MASFVYVAFFAAWQDRVVLLRSCCYITTHLASTAIS